MFVMKHVANQLNLFYVASPNFSLTYTCIFYSLKTLESILYVSILKNKNKDVFL